MYFKDATVVFGNKANSNPGKSSIHCGFHNIVQTDGPEIQLLLFTFDNLSPAVRRNPCTSEKQGFSGALLQIKP